MKPKKRIQEMTFAALLTAIAILIPSIMPIKLIIPPASYTLGSHVPIFLAMFISPWVAAFVILASSLGYFMAGYPIVIVFRAFSHIIFGFLGALYLKKFPRTIENHKSSLLFNFVLRFLAAINGLMGDKHDDMVADDMENRQSYDAPVALDSDIRQRLELLISRFPL